MDPSEDSTELLTLDENGFCVAVNIHTGEVRQLEASQSNPTSMLELSKMHKILDKSGNVVYVSPNISLENLEKVQGKRRTFPYSPMLADMICEEIAGGKTLIQISQTPGMPKYSDIARWRRLYPDFDEAYKQARKDRAEVYFHKILQEVEQATADKDEVALARLRADMYKFAAKVSSPDEYAEKQTLDARIGIGPIAIETGIRRPGDTGYNRDETLNLLKPANEIPDPLAEEESE